MEASSILAPISCSTSREHSSAMLTSCGSGGASPGLVGPGLDGPFSVWESVHPWDIFFFKVARPPIAATFLTFNFLFCASIFSCTIFSEWNSLSCSSYWRCRFAYLSRRSISSLCGFCTSNFAIVSLYCCGGSSLGPADLHLSISSSNSVRSSAHCVSFRFSSPLSRSTSKAASPSDCWESNSAVKVSTLTASSNFSCSNVCLSDCNLWISSSFAFSAPSISLTLVSSSTTCSSKLESVVVMTKPFPNSSSSISSIIRLRAVVVLSIRGLLSSSSEFMVPWSSPIPLMHESASSSTSSRRNRACSTICSLASLIFVELHLRGTSISKGSFPMSA
eukprot:comp18064_c0_seq1/m.18642 comp18064_c0_seq1/g.18642  ORF comp18064_c0_seq1/g.18642 comp18064_c0_seq1/m.18642 type:complete len:334 (+) comp18064_c0_seq1:396-1397(+)